MLQLLLCKNNKLIYGGLTKTQLLKRPSSRLGLESFQCYTFDVYCRRVAIWVDVGHTQSMWNNNIQHMMQNSQFRFVASPADEEGQMINTIMNKWGSCMNASYETPCPQSIHQTQYILVLLCCVNVRGLNPSAPSHPPSWKKGLEEQHGSSYTSTNQRMASNCRQVCSWQTALPY
jgi:hypothetical protein